jgi:hypothetical protein
MTRSTKGNVWAIGRSAGKCFRRIAQPPIRPFQSPDWGRPDDGRLVRTRAGAAGAGVLAAAPGDHSGGVNAAISVRSVPMKGTTAKVQPDDFGAALSSEERLDAALRVAREAFKGSDLTLAEVETAVRKVRRKRHRARGAHTARRR